MYLHSRRGMSYWGFRVDPRSARRGIFGIAQEPSILQPVNSSRGHNGSFSGKTQRILLRSMIFHLLFVLKEDSEEPPILLWTWVDQPWFSLHRFIWGNYSARQRAVHLVTQSSFHEPWLRRSTSLAALTDSTAPTSSPLATWCRT